MTTELDVTAVGARAAQILAQIEAHPLYTHLTESSLKYTCCWFTTTGYATISDWNVERDSPKLAIEGLRVLALKATVLEATGDEKRAELLVAAPVDEMVHAILAQRNVMTKIQTDLGSGLRTSPTWRRSAARPTGCTRLPAGAPSRCATGEHHARQMPPTSGANAGFAANSDRG